jgi:Flp pilus assembly protein TadD
MIVARYYVAQTASEHSQYAKALAAYEDILLFCPLLTSLHVSAAQNALAAGKPEKALEHLEAANSHNPADHSLACLRANTLLAQGNLQGAKQIWQEAKTECPGTLSNLRNLGMLTATQSPEQALAHLRLADDLYPEGSPIACDLIQTIEDSRVTNQPAFTLAQVGQAFTRYEEWQFSKWAFRKALDLESTYIEALAYLGLVLDLSGEDGLETLNAAASAAPNEHNQPEQALHALEKAANLAPDDPTVAALLGDAYADLGDYQSARSAYLRATELSPQEPKFWLILANYSLDHKIEIETLGLPAARNAVALDPIDPASKDALGYAYYLLGNFPLAERILHQSIELDPQRAITQYHLGLLRLAQDDFPGAYSAFQTAILLDPDGLAGTLSARTLAHLEP